MTAAAGPAEAAAAPRAFLGVACSARGRRWEGPDAAEARAAAAIVQATGLPPLVAGILARRGVAPEGAAAYLAPTLRALMPDPSHLLDVEIAAARLVRAAEAGERVAIFADYDVDGAASAALILDWLAARGRSATLYVPDRIGEGFGPNAPAMARLASDHDLIVCVDCGTMSHDAVAAARGADVVILDHHQADAALPDCLAVVNPNRLDQPAGLGHLCAAGVVFLTLAAANRQLRRAGDRVLPDLLASLDLVALATIADVARLEGVNRAFVRQGLRVMASGQRVGLAALAAAAGIGGPLTPFHLGFVLGPRINAGGRVGQADLGARLLSTRDRAEAARLAEALDRLNTARRTIEAAVLEEARAQVEARHDPDAPLVWAAGANWHPGVVGIVAARLKEAFDRPALVIGFEGMTGRGSARSVPGVDIGRAVGRLAAEGAIEAGGGHAMAAGLSLSRGQVAPAMARLSALLAAAGAGPRGGRVLRLDGVIAPAAATPALVAAIEAAGPFGAGSPAPRVALAGVRVAGLRPMGAGHLALGLSDGAGARLDAVAFGAANGPLEPFLRAQDRPALHVAGRLERDDWGGRARVRLVIEDVAEDRPPPP